MQLIAAFGGGQLTTSTRYAGLTNLSIWTLTAAQGLMPWGIAGKFKSIYFILSNAPGAGKSRTFTLDVAGSGTALSVTISDTNTIGFTVADVSVSAFQTVRITHTDGGTNPTSTDTVFMAIDFEPTVSGLSGYGTHCTSAPSNSVANYNGVFSGKSAWNTSVTNIIENVIPCNGNIINGGMLFDQALTGAQTRTATLWLDGVEQNGSGGTVDTRIIGNSGNPSAPTATFSLPVTAGQRIYTAHVPTNSPSATGRVAIFYGFQPSDGKSFAICGSTSVNPSTGVVAYYGPSVCGYAGNVTEGLVAMPTGRSIYKAKALYAAMASAPGAAKSYTYALRVNSASPGGTLSAQIAGTTTPAVGSDTSGQTKLSPGDFWDISLTPSGTPTASLGAWGIALEALSGGNGNTNKGGNGPKGVGGKQIFGPAGMLFWDAINGFGQ